MPRSLQDPFDRHFLDLDAIDATALRGILDTAASLKRARAGTSRGVLDAGAPLDGKILAMIFERSSTRTRVSFDVAMRQLGGSALMLSAGQTQLGRGETVADTARVLSRYADAIMIRTSKHENLLELAAHAEVPVINGLTEYSHPCQIMADILTFEEHRGPIAQRRVAWLGDGNNVCVSWIHAAVKFQFALNLACPDGFLPEPEVMDWARQAGGEVTVFDDPHSAAANADCIVTDTWVSMGQVDGDERTRALRPYQVNRDIMAAAHPDALFMHCLPAHRGEEVTAEILDGPQSVVWDEAENRLHAQKGILLWCFGIAAGERPN